MSAELTIVESQPAAWSEDDLKALKDAVAKDCNEAQFKVFVMAARHLSLDPFARQIIPIVQSGKMTPQVTIDGFRLIAERSGKYGGQVGPYWCGPDGKWQDVWLSDTDPVAAKVGIKRRDFDEIMWGVARTKAYKGGSPTWAKLADVMIAKVAESLALRKAFPMELSGVYTSEEMDQAREPAPQARQTVTATHTDHVTGEVIEATSAPASAPEPATSMADGDSPFEQSTNPLDNFKTRALALGYEWHSFQTQAFGGKSLTRDGKIAAIAEFLVAQETDAWLHNPEVNQRLEDLGHKTPDQKAKYLTVTHLDSLDETLLHLREMCEKGTSAGRRATSLRTTDAIPTGAAS